MDIEFSQVGQQIAQVAKVPRVSELGPDNKNEQDQATIRQQVEQQQDAQQTKVIEDTADTEQRTNVSEQQLESAVAQISEFVQNQNRSLSFSIDESSNRSVVKVTDSGSGEVIRQIPTQEALDLAERIQTLPSDIGAAVGVLFDRAV